MYVHIILKVERERERALETVSKRGERGGRSSVKGDIKCTSEVMNLLRERCTERGRVPPTNHQLGLFG